MQSNLTRLFWMELKTTKRHYSQLTEKAKWTFWPTQYFKQIGPCSLLFTYLGQTHGCLGLFLGVWKQSFLLVAGFFQHNITSKEDLKFHLKPLINLSFHYEASKGYFSVKLMPHVLERKSKNRPADRTQGTKHSYLQSSFKGFPSTAQVHQLSSNLE